MPEIAIRHVGEREFRRRGERQHTHTPGDGADALPELHTKPVFVRDSVHPTT